MSFKALAFFDQKTYTIGVMAHQILPKFRVSLKVSKLMFLRLKNQKKIESYEYIFRLLQSSNVEC